jgi:hypothetical protein
MAIARDGNIWTNDLINNKIRTYTKIDVKTGEVKNFPVAVGREGYVRGSHGMTTGPDGIIWLNLFAGAGMQNDPEIDGGLGGLGRIDPTTEKLEIFTPPPGMAGVGAHLEVDVNNKVWASTSTGAIRFDPETKQFTQFKSATPGSRRYASTYGVAGDSEGNGWWAIITADKVGFADVKTGKTGEVELPPEPALVELMTKEDRAFYEKEVGDLSGLNANVLLPWAQAPRRLGGDPKGKVIWVGNFFGHTLAEIDIRTHKVTYHKPPLPFSGPYDVETDNNSVAWVALRHADRLGKFDPRTQQWTVFLLPTLGAEPRYVTVDRPRGDVWLAYSRTPKVARIQTRTEEELRGVTK